jgi:type III secretory pathway component EscV
MSEEYLLFFLTSEDCGVCQHFRGNGIIGNEKEYMKYDKIRNILDKGVTFFNIHSSIRNGKNSNIIDISKFSLREHKGETKIIQEKCYKYQDKTRVLILEMGKDKKTIATDTITVREDKGEKEIAWIDYVKRHIPQKLENFTGLYVPEILVTTKNSWINSMEKSLPLLAIPDRSYVVKRNSDYFISKNPKDVHQRVVKLEKILEEIEKNTFVFREHKTETEKTPENQKNKEKQNIKGFRYVYYDDPV